MHDNASSAQEFPHPALRATFSLAREKENAWLGSAKLKGSI
jgi:hypothetical protein